MMKQKEWQEFLVYPMKGLYQLEEKVTTLLLQLVSLEMRMNTTYHA